jgi:hypothetical protein
MCACPSVSKVIIGLLNGAIIIGAIVAGVYLYQQRDNVPWASFALAEVPPRVILAVVCFAIASALIGLLAICCDNCIRLLYLVTVVLVILIEISAVIVALVYKDKILTSIDDHWQDPDYQESRITVEKQFQCCGFETPEEVAECGFKPETGSENVTCKDKIAKSIATYEDKIVIGAVVLAVAEILLLISAAYLKLHKDNESHMPGITKF